MIQYLGILQYKMSYKIKVLDKNNWPPLLLQINDLPKRLNYAGEIPDYNRKFLAVVGARKYSNYGRDVVNTLLEGLSGFPITIVSGLALGIDSLSHRAAIKNKLPTIAVPGSGLSPVALHPSTHVSLAEEIVGSGGTLISEYENDFKATQWSFPQRNRIMAGMCHAVLIVEAETKSGTLITAKLATGYNRDVLVVPGSIFSPNSDGPHLLLKLGATPIRNSDDILEALHISTLDMNYDVRLKIQDKDINNKYSECSEKEIFLIKILETPMERDLLIRTASAQLPVSEIQTLLTLLEIKGLIEEKLGEIRLV